MRTATKRLAPSTMEILLLLLPSLALAANNLPPEPSSHLTPPRQSSALDTQSGNTEQLVRRPRNDSSGNDGPKPSESDQKLEPHQQEARAILWAAPAIPILSSHRGRSSDCNPCDRVPWVPMARALNTQQYALSIPTIQLTLPVNYGIPIAQMRPPPPQYGPPPPHSQPPPPPHQQSPPSHQQPSPTHQHSSPPHQQPPPPSSQYGPPPSSQYGPPPPPQQPPAPSSQYGPPPQQYGPPSQQPPHSSFPSHQYGPPSSPPSTGDAKINGSPSNQYGPPDSEKDGLPPPPLPQRFLSPSRPYGQPQPQTQHTSSSNNNPTSLKFRPPPSPSLPKHQLLPGLKFGPPFNPNVPPNYNPPPRAPLSQPPANSPPPSYTNARPNISGPQQYRGETPKQPVLIQNPIPFPSMSKEPLPPFYNYQIFNDGKQDQLHSYLQPPKPQNVVVTITENDDSCKKCLEKHHDSEPAPAEHVTENVLKTTEKYSVNSLDHQKPSVQIVKSVPLAEYLASVEYPMQIVQAPILDVPDLAKYFDLGYHNFPQVHNQQGNTYKVEDQNPSSSFSQPNPIYVNHNLHSSNITPSIQYTTGLDNVELTADQFQTTNTIPHNHKPDVNVLGKNQGTTEKGFTSSPFVSTTLSHSTLTPRPSQIFHINKKPTTHSQPSTLTTAGFSTSQGFSTATGHYVTSTPTTEGKIEQQLPSTGTPKPFRETPPSSLQDHLLSETPEGLNPPAPSDLRFLDHPPIGSGAISDWTLHSYGRGWGTTPPQPFAVPTPSSHNPRFSVRPTAAPSKKGKLIHQIIVPYTTNKQTQTPSIAREPSNNLGWTPLPPTNQGRRVPSSHIQFENQFPSSVGLDQTHQSYFPTGNFHVTSNIPLSASGTDNLASQQVPPTGNGQPINLPPHVINQILHLNQPGSSWPSGPEELQQLLVSNLQGLLRGEEDSIDITRLQKNIDNWTAEGYKQNSPSVNFIPVTPITHIFNSKKIPAEYLTSTEPSSYFNSTQQENFDIFRHNFESDHEGAESQKHQVKVHPDAHSKDYDETEDTTESIQSLLNSWSLLDTKMASPSSTTTEETITPESSVATDATSKAWEKIQVSISPLTNEKVYVVTPVPVAAAADPESTTTVLSTRVERSYSVIAGGGTEPLNPPSPQSDGATRDAVSNKH